MAEHSDFEDHTFTIAVTMTRRWVPHFLGMLEAMQRYGDLGRSRFLTFYADGDGDFRPKFVFSRVEDIAAADPVKDEDGDLTFDAG